MVSRPSLCLRHLRAVKSPLQLWQLLGKEGERQGLEHRPQPFTALPSYACWKQRLRAGGWNVYRHTMDMVQVLEAKNYSIGLGSLIYERGPCKQGEFPEKRRKRQGGRKEGETQRFGGYLRHTLSSLVLPETALLARWVYSGPLESLYCYNL